MAIDQFPIPTTGATVPTADATTNTYARDVIGNKTDAAVTAVATDKGLMGYVKHVVNVINTLFKSPNAYESGYLGHTPGTSGSYSSYETIVTSLAATMWAASVTMMTNGSAGQSLVTVQIASGTAGNEVVIWEGVMGNMTPAGTYLNQFGLIFKQVASGTRLAVRAKAAGANVGVLNIDLAVYER